MRRLSAANPYTFEKQGSFGRFKTGKSLPVEYLMTTLTMAEL